MSTQHARGPQYTAEQAQAVGMRDISLAVSAGAGCGKTFVLTERFLIHFDPADPEALRPDELHRLVAITFTERAAREMRDRIRQKCYQRQLAARDEDVDYWIALGRELEGARISTIHSFCAALLRTHAVEAQLDPRFRVLEQAQADTLLAECIDDLLRELLAAADPAALDLVVQFGLETLRRMVTRLVGRGDREAFATWLARTPDELVEIWQRRHQTEVAPAALYQLATLPAADALLRIAKGPKPDHPVMRARCAVLMENLTAWRAIGAAVCVDDLDRVRQIAMVQGGGGKNCWESPETYVEFKEAAETLRKKIDTAREIFTFEPAEALPAARAGLEVLALAERACRRYDEAKQKLGVLDFNDLMVRARSLLSAPQHAGLRQRLAAQIRLLMVDECQDTDPVQIELVEALCGEGLSGGRLFSVGDFKQSIYRFRGADPRVFHALRERIPAEGRLPLTLNFRSQPAILHFVNRLFHDELGPNYEPLRPERPQVVPTPCIEFLWAEVPDAARSKRPAREREADWIARRLRALLDSRAPIVSQRDAAGQLQTRPVEPGDVALLLRALSDVQYYEEALRRYGIDYYLVGGHAFYAQQEIFDLVNLLRSIDCPADGVSLAGVLRSPMFSLADESLYWLAQHRDGLAGGLFAEPPTQLDPQQRRRVEFAASTLAWLRGNKDSLGVAELIGAALARTGYDAVLLGEFLGERKLANLRKLIDQARSFDRSCLFALSDFIAQLAGFVAEQPEEPLAATHPEATNVVRLMSIHQAKGLEFPVVVVPDLDRGTHGLSPLVELDAEWGPLVQMPKGPDGTSAVSGHKLFFLVEDQEEQEEHKRLLYVATTRAADYLILSSGVADLSKPTGPWMRLVARHFDLATGRPVPADAADGPVPEIRVTRDESQLGGAQSKPRDSKDLAGIARRCAEMRESETRLPTLTGSVAPDLAARRQYSFSRLFGTLHRAPPQQAEAGEAAEDPAVIDPLSLGTLVHAVLAKIEFGSAVDVGALCRQDAARHGVAGAEVEQAREMIERFLQSDAARHLAAGQRAWAELEFMLSWPPGGPDHGIYLSGFLDRLYRDAQGAWHLVDFKTNRVDAAGLAQAAAVYEPQMLVYALAVETIVGQPPASVTLQFLRAGLAYAFTWNAEARRQAVARVEAAIARATGAQAGSVIS